MNNPDSERLVASRSELTGQQVSDRFPKKDVEGIDAVMEEENTGVLSVIVRSRSKRLDCVPAREGRRGGYIGTTHCFFSSKKKV